MKHMIGICVMELLVRTTHLALTLLRIESRAWLDTILQGTITASKESSSNYDFVMLRLLINQRDRKILTRIEFIETDTKLS